MVKERKERQKTMKKQKNASSNNTKFVDNSQGHHHYTKMRPSSFWVSLDFK
jgi:hypothetical protein